MINFFYKVTFQKFFQKHLELKQEKFFTKIIKTIKVKLFFSYSLLESKVEIILLSSILIANSQMCSNIHLFGKKN